MGIPYYVTAPSMVPVQCTYLCRLSTMLCEFSIHFRTKRKRGIVYVMTKMTKNDCPCVLFLVLGTYMNDYFLHNNLACVRKSKVVSTLTAGFFEVGSTVLCRCPLFSLFH
jgi:hypothetical protein